jgi:hypothetical protein
MLNKAKRVYEEWMRTGRKVDANGFLDLDRSSSYTVVKFLLPKIDIKARHLTQFSCFSYSRGRDGLISVIVFYPTTSPAPEI